MKIKKIFFRLLVIVGIIFIIIPFYNDYKIKQNMNEATISVDDMPADELKKNDEQVLKNEYFDFSKIKEISPTSTFLGAENIDKSLFIGQIVIPSVDMNLTIFKGATDNNLLAGVATMKPDDKMGENNFTLAGHYNKDKSILFGSLMDVKIDDVIKITDKNKIYEYRVYETKTVDDTAIYMIKNEEAQKRGNPIISLMTCYYSSKTGKRYFVLGDLVKTYPYDKKLMESDTPEKS
ncbi:class A sortase [Peptoanaerobacter stomatis]|uniref:class A sortase n=1 Tax=Peptoanaerobacter stomatis TaxID=796937 RepID=UPI003F9EFB45